MNVHRDIMKCGCETVANEMNILHMCENHEWMLCDEWEIKETVE